MARVHRRRLTWEFGRGPEVIWPLLADTARFNEAAGLPKQQIEETPQPDGSVRMIARARWGRFALSWRERPVNWVTGRWFEHRRDFLAGPLAFLTARLDLAPTEGGCRAVFTIEAAAANLLGALLLRGGFFRGVERTYLPLVAAAGAYARGERETLFDVAAPKLLPDAAARVAELVRRIEESEHGHGLATRLGDLVLHAPEVDLAHIRPLALARAWKVPPRQAVELCLEATRVGLLTLDWTLLCPRCRIAKASVRSLDELPKGAHCGTCNIDYGRDFSRNVELSFRPAEAVRPIATGEYCLLGPMSTPHIRVHVSVPAGERRRVGVGLPPGPYRLRTLEAGGECDIEHKGGAFPSVLVDGASVRATAPATMPATMPGGDEEDGVTLVNQGAHERVVVIEDRRWVADALTADRVTALQAFRDLFSAQVLRPGDEVSVRHMTLLFTDLGGSTRLYGTLGDARAYRLVREHFAFLARLVREHDGAVVKTIGDAIMAAFADPADALRAALAAQAEIGRFNAAQDDGPIVLKLGLHAGPCIAVTLNDRLDYFGSTVNVAARLQAESRGGDVVVSAALAADPAVAEVLHDIPAEAESASVRGVDAPVAFLRLQS